MRTVAYSDAYEAHVEDVLKTDDHINDPRVLAVEWELARASAFDCYPLIGSTSAGFEVRAVFVEPTNVLEAVLFIFALESPTKIEILDLAPYTCQ